VGERLGQNPAIEDLNLLLEGPPLAINAKKDYS
jgi:hypothetical protein